uniref:Deoxyribodipyrimidine photo-lyase n=1 Tax=Paramormyrops kingsleyae TaxID=1676925 RepID=A0A3B3QLS7_9TELE|nr:deoxyribodipyrimidine photo-lyase-like isoform X2 [Paramormyrops kingsleyae]
MSGEKTSVDVARKRRAESAAASGRKEPKLLRTEGWLVAEVDGLRRAASGAEVNTQRLRFLSQTEKVKQGSQGVLYWMCRDQRVQDNWALLYAQQLALAEQLPLHVCFCLMPRFLDATIRQFGFMLEGLREVATECRTLEIQFHLLLGAAAEVLPGFVKDWALGTVVTDFFPLRVPLQWVEDVKKGLPLDVPFIQVDAHNVVPCWLASDKQEYSARTMRGKITKLLPKFLTEFPPVEKHPHCAQRPVASVDWDRARSFVKVDPTVGEVQWARAGTAAGMATLESFIEQRLHSYAAHRNDPNCAALSHLSPWLHAGQISAQRAVLQVRRGGARGSPSVDAFVEEAVLRRELADNFCYYNRNYDCVEGAYEWARMSLQDHAKDHRPYLYSRQELEGARTGDKLWNAAQNQLVLEGKMHGFMRMYWAKKILEWTSSPEEALSISLYLNDRYSLDGNDPNGYVGCMWSICGIHDQGWKERPIFGNIRYMNYNGCKRKFDVSAFEKQYGPKQLKIS